MVEKIMNIILFQNFRETTNYNNKKQNPCATWIMSSPKNLLIFTCRGFLRTDLNPKKRPQRLCSNIEFFQIPALSLPERQFYDRKLSANRKDKCNWMDLS